MKKQEACKEHGMQLLPVPYSGSLHQPSWASLRPLAVSSDSPKAGPWEPDQPTLEVLCLEMEEVGTRALAPSNDNSVMLYTLKLHEL